MTAHQPEWAMRRARHGGVAMASALTPLPSSLASPLLGGHPPVAIRTPGGQPGPLARKLGRVMPLLDEERQALSELPVQVQDLRPEQDVLREGDRLSACHLLLSGFACRYKLLDEGRRQIYSFHVPGDFLDLEGLHLGSLDHSVCALGPARAALVPHAGLRAAGQRFPRIAEALWRDGLADAAAIREAVVGLGRRSAYARIAHLFCELVRRMQAAGLAAEGSRPAIELPLTQTHVADALGLSVVHVNRVLQVLRAEELLTWKSGLLTVCDWNGLRRAGEFDPAYLRLPQDKAA